MGKEELPFLVKLVIEGKEEIFGFPTDVDRQLFIVDIEDKYGKLNYVTAEDHNQNRGK